MAINRLLAILGNMRTLSGALDTVETRDNETPEEREERVRGICETMRVQHKWLRVRKAIGESMSCEVDAMLSRYMPLGTSWKWNAYTLTVAHLTLRQADLHIFGTEDDKERALMIANCVCLGFLKGRCV